MATEVLRYTAFTTDPRGGNPAGVVLDAAGMTAADMLAIAADVGYSETAFLRPRAGEGESCGSDEYDVQYFSPAAEVPFCGHATIASAVALAERGASARLLFHTLSGPVTIDIDGDGDGGGDGDGDGDGRRHPTATLTSVEPDVTGVDPATLTEALSALDWDAAELDPALPPRVGYAGVRHLIVAAATRDRLARLSYDYPRLRRLMLGQDWTTVHLVWRESPTVFHARDPFPVGGVVEDPATGAAAAAFGAYLRSLAAVDPTAKITIRQGEDLGRPSTLTVLIDSTEHRIRVSGTAVPIPVAPTVEPDDNGAALG